MQSLNKETNSKLEQMAESEGLEEEVEEMFERLNREVQESREKMVEKKGVKVEIEAMDIEEPKKNEQLQLG